MTFEEKQLHEMDMRRLKSDPRMSKVVSSYMRIPVFGFVGLIAGYFGLPKLFRMDLVGMRIGVVACLSGGLVFGYYSALASLDKVDPKGLFRREFYRVYSEKNKFK